MEINHSLSIAMDLYWIRFIDLLFYNSLLDGVPEYRDICRKGYESGLITRIISATCCQLSGNHCLSEYMAFLCRKQRKKNKHQSTKKGNDMEFVGIEKQLFEELVRKFEYFEHRVMEICNRENDRTLHKWIKH